MGMIFLLPWLSKRIKAISLFVICSTILLATNLYLNASVVNANEDSNFVMAYKVKVNGCDIGLIRDKTAIDTLEEQIKNDYRNLFLMDVTLEKDIDFDEVYVDEKYLNSINDIDAIIRNNTHVKVKAVSMSINGDTIGILSSEERVERLLEAVKKPYIEASLKAGGDLDDISIQENIEIHSVEIDYSQIESVNQVYERIIKGSDEIY